MFSCDQHISSDDLIFVRMSFRRQLNKTYKYNRVIDSSIQGIQEDYGSKLILVQMFNVGGEEVFRWCLSFSRKIIEIVSGQKYITGLCLINLTKSD